MPTFALNFSRPGAQVLLQYYMFLRLGCDGYRRVQQASQDIALYLSGEIAKMDAVRRCGTTVATSRSSHGGCKPGHTDNWNLYHLSDRLRAKGWLVPAYPMPADLQDLTVQRVVVRNGLGRDLAQTFLTDLATEVAYLDGLSGPMPPESHGPGFHH